MHVFQNGYLALTDMQIPPCTASPLTPPAPPAPSAQSCVLHSCESSDINVDLIWTGAGGSGHNSN